MNYAPSSVCISQFACLNHNDLAECKHYTQIAQDIICNAKRDEIVGIVQIGPYLLWQPYHKLPLCDDVQKICDRVTPSMHDEPIFNCAIHCLMPTLCLDVSFFFHKSYFTWLP